MLCSLRHKVLLQQTYPSALHLQRGNDCLPRGSSAGNSPIRLWLLMTLVLLASIHPGKVLALDPHKSIGQYGHDVWLRQNGLPANIVNTLLQSSDGYLWVGTTSGLYRFDGVRFSECSLDTQKQKISETIAAVCESSDRSIWVGTLYGGLRRIKDDQVSMFGEKEGLPERQIRTLFESRAGHLWVGTTNGLFRSSGNTFVPVPVDQTFFTGITEDTQGRIWVATHDGVRIFDDERMTLLQSLRTAEGLPDKITTAIASDSKGSVWVGTSHGLFKWKNGSTTVYSTGNGLHNDHVGAMHEDKDGNFWVGTFGGLYRERDDVWTSFTVDDGLSNNQVLSITEDREGSLWVGTLEGLNRFKDVNLTTYTTKDGLGNDYVSGIAETPDGAIYFLSNANSTVSCLRNGRMSTFSSSVGPTYVARDGSLWIGQNGTLINIRNGHITRFDTTAGLPAKWISAITEDAQGLIIFVDHTGLKRFTGGRARPFLLRDGRMYPSTEYVECFYTDPGDTLWVGTTNGLVRMYRGEYSVFGTVDGMADYWVSAIYDDHRGSLWFGSANGGLTRYSNGRFTAYSAKSGLFSNEIYCVLGDARGDLWLGSSRGIEHIARADLDGYAAGTLPAMSSHVYSMVDGMKSDACFDEWQPAGIRATDGRLWFSTKKGAVMIDPGAFKRNEVVPPVRIEKVVVEQRTVAPEQKLVFEPGTKNLEFHYTALSFLVPERTLFKYKLEGYDRDWVEAGTRRAAYYTSLPPGNYRFRVIACNNDGLWNEDGADIGVILTPHFYETYWFTVLVAGVILALIVLIVKMRLRTLQRREKELERIVHVRTKEVQDQRSFLRKVIDLNPSFIFAKDSEGRFTLANRALSEAYGATSDGLIGRTDEAFNRHGEQVDKFRADDREVFESKTEKYIPEERFTGADGESRWLQVSKIPITSEEGTVQQVLAVATDITAQKAAKEVAEAATRSKSEFLANMSHEIRTPMNAVIGMSGLLGDTNLDAEQREFVDIIRTSGDTLLTIINDILDFSKIESGKLELETQAFDLARCIEDSLDLLSSKASEKSIELAYLLDARTPRDIVGDRTRLRQILMNLVGNAVKFTQNGEVIVSVSSKLLQDDEYELQFAVRDTGIGIPKDRLDRLFKSFSQVDSSTTRHYGGTGLGLAISKRLSEMMKGRMWVESTEGKGSTFSFTIIATAAPSITRVSRKDGELQLDGKAVLIVDDNASNRQILTLQTQSWGMKPTAVADGRQALELLKQEKKFSLAILDMQMPEMNGAQLSIQIRRTSGLPALPLILLTSVSESSRQLREQYGELSIAAHLNKPVKSSQLYETIVSVLADHITTEQKDPVSEAKAVEGGTTRRLRILVAEDNVINQKVAVRILERFGYRADIAANGVEAIEAIRRQSYDLVFMDVHMPGMDGLEATRHICSEWPTGRPKIIAMTADALQGDREQCLEAGMDGYISKPVRVEELRTILEKYEAEVCDRV